MAVGFSNTNKPINPRGNDASPKGYNRASLFSGKALDFDGVNDVVTTTYTSGFTGVQEFTYCAYVNADDIASAQAVVHANEATGWGLQSLWVASNTFRFYAGTGVEPTSFVNSETIEANKWYFVVGVHTPTENKIYLNGVLNATAAAANLTTAPQAITIGRFPSVTLPFNGETANAKIFNTALTAAQVADLYNNPEKVVPTGVADSALKLWLPMQEGAGTTAYDGSGNANHGTISGATYTHGIGAPVSQTAVMNWNKGTNRFTYSEQFDTGDWNKISTSVTANTLTAPDGQTTADSLNSTSSTEAIYQLAQVGVNSFSVYAKAGTTTSLQLASTTGFNGRGADFNLSNGTAGAVYEVGSGNSNITGGTSAIESVGNGWYRCSINGLTLTAIRAVTIANNNGNLSYIWGASVEQSATAGPYVRTGATAQTSEVLLPQGLTTGRDITGVNLFENVRKQGALNLDGNSWAEVHDNESLDVTTAVTLEAWVNNKTGELSINNRYMPIFDKATNVNGTGGFTLRLYSSVNSNGGYFAVGGAYVLFNFTDGSYQHIVATLSANSQKIYINGVLQNSFTNAWTIPQNGNPLLIGYAPSDGEQWLNASVAQPRIYNRALTASEVLQNYNSGKNTYK